MEEANVTQNWGSGNMETTECLTLQNKLFSSRNLGAVNHIPLERTWILVFYATNCREKEFSTKIYDRFSEGVSSCPDLQQYAEYESLFCTKAMRMTKEIRTWMYAWLKLKNEGKQHTREWCQLVQKKKKKRDKCMALQIKVKKCYWSVQYSFFKNENKEKHSRQWSSFVRIFEVFTARQKRNEIKQTEESSSNSQPLDNFSKCTLLENYNQVLKEKWELDIQKGVCVQNLAKNSFRGISLSYQNSVKNG